MLWGFFSEAGHNYNYTVLLDQLKFTQDQKSSLQHGIQPKHTAKTQGFRTSPVNDLQKLSQILETEIESLWGDLKLAGHRQSTSNLAKL